MGCPSCGAGNPSDLMEAFATSTAVNHAGQDAPETVEPLPPAR